MTRSNSQACVEQSNNVLIVVLDFFLKGLRASGERHFTELPIPKKFEVPQERDVHVHIDQQ